MNREDEFIYLFTHFSKHYRAGGIGCRHVLDLWVYLQANPELDEGYIVSELKRLYLLEFYQNIRRLLAMWFEDGAADEKIGYMAAYVFDSGSFGRHSEWLLSMAIRKSRTSGQDPTGKLSVAFAHLFPKISQIINQYPFLEKCPFLLPAVWFIRPFQKLLFDRKSIARTMRDMKTLNREAVDARQEMLRYVGLDYNF